MNILIFRIKLQRNGEKLNVFHESEDGSLQRIFLIASGREHHMQMRQVKQIEHQKLLDKLSADIFSSNKFGRMFAYLSASERKKIADHLAIDLIQKLSEALYYKIIAGSLVISSQSFDFQFEYSILPIDAVVLEEKYNK